MGAVHVRTPKNFVLEERLERYADAIETNPEAYAGDWREACAPVGSKPFEQSVLGCLCIQMKRLGIKLLCKGSDLCGIQGMGATAKLCAHMEIIKVDFGKCHGLSHAVAASAAQGRDSSIGKFTSAAKSASAASIHHIQS